MTRALLLSLFSISLYGCKACVGEIPLDNNNDDDDQEDTAPEDTAEDTGPVDTGPLPPCAIPEVEPNNLDFEAQRLPMEQWACGTLLEDGDIETFYFDVPQTGWYRVWLRGQDIGSSSNLQLSIIEPTAYGTLALDSPGDLDPQIVFYAESAARFMVNISDTYYGYGEDYIWEMMATETKEPVEWTTVEEEWVDDAVSNNALVDGQFVSNGDKILGLLNPGSDQDFYIVDVPEGEVTLKAQIDAWNHGSPLSSVVSVYDLAGNVLSERAYGTSGADLDPRMVYKTTSTGERLAIRVDVQNNSGGGGMAHWYMLSIDIEVK